MTQDKTMKKSQLPEPTGMTIMKSLHFRVDGKFLSELAVRLFWFEDEEKKAMSILSSFNGITNEQRNKIIWGKATMEGMSICGKEDCEQCKDETNPLHYTEKVDKSIQKEIGKRIQWLEKNHFKMGEFHVRKEVVYNYLGELKLYENLVNNESQVFMDLLEKNFNIFYNAIFQACTILPPSPDNVPKYGTRRYEFAMELERFLERRKEELMQSEEVERILKQRMRDLQRDTLMTRYSISKAIKGDTEVLREFVNANKSKTEKKPLFTKEQIESSPKIEMVLESGKKLMVPQILLDEYANSVRVTRMELLTGVKALSFDSIMQSQARLNTRIDNHKAIYKSVGIVYHGEYDYWQQKSKEQFPDKKGQEFFRKMSDEERDSIEFNSLIEKYVGEKYPDMSRKIAFGFDPEERYDEKKENSS